MLKIPSEIYLKLSPDGSQLVLTTEHDPEGIEFIKGRLYHSLDRIRLQQAQRIDSLWKTVVASGVHIDP